jgi:L-amino acid N-acyltransferase YncA
LFEHHADRLDTPLKIEIARTADAGSLLDLRNHYVVGFTPVGVFSEYARKNGKAISSQWMERVMDENSPR